MCGALSAWCVSFREGRARLQLPASRSHSLILLNPLTSSRSSTTRRSKEFLDPGAPPAGPLTAATPHRRQSGAQPDAGGAAGSHRGSVWEATSEPLRAELGDAMASCRVAAIASRRVITTASCPARGRRAPRPPLYNCRVPRWLRPFRLSGPPPRCRFRHAPAASPGFASPAKSAPCRPLPPRSPPPARPCRRRGRSPRRATAGVFAARSELPRAAPAPPLPPRLFRPSGTRPPPLPAFPAASVPRVALSG